MSQRAPLRGRGAVATQVLNLSAQRATLSTRHGMKSNANTVEAASQSAVETPVREAKSVKAVTPLAKSTAPATHVSRWWVRVIIAHPGMQVLVFFTLLLLY